MVTTSRALRDKPRLLASAITEWKQALQQSRESEERYRSMAELASDGMLTMDPGGMVTSCNSAFTTLTGFTREEIVGKHILELPTTPAIPKAKYAKVLGSIISGKPPTPFEFEWVHRDGSLRRGECHVCLIRVDNKIVGIQAIGRDITERKRAEEALRRSEQDYLVLLESTSEGIAVVDAKTLKVVFGNHRAAKMFGFDPIADYPPVVNILKFVHPEDKGIVIKGFAEDLRKEERRQRYEVRAKTKDGREIWVSALGTRIEFQGREAALLSLTDITELKQAELELNKYRQHLEELVEERTIELRDANEQLQQEIVERKRAEHDLRVKDWAIASSINAIVMADFEGNVVYVNASFLRMWGYDSSEETVGKSAVEFWQDRKKAARVVMTLLRKGIWQGELVALRADGSTFDVQVLASMVEDDEGEPICLVASIIDITERKKAEEKVERLYQRERELRQQFEAEMKRRAEFTRALAHELKTPLTPVVMSSQLLTSELKDETLLKVAQNISRGASNLNSRIDELLDLARGEIGMLQIKLGQVEVLQLLREVVEDMFPVTSSRRQCLILKLPPSLPLVWCDKSRLRQIVLNLLNNAFKFTPEGGEITLGAKQEDGNLVVEVWDTGPGIAEEEQQRIFNPYHRKESDRERLSGLGLGLALSKTLVELHRGRIWVKSRAGKGSTFGFSLPLEGPQSVANPNGQAPTSES